MATRLRAPVSSFLFFQYTRGRDILPVEVKVRLFCLILIHFPEATLCFLSSLLLLKRTMRRIRAVLYLHLFTFFTFSRFFIIFWWMIRKVPWNVKVIFYKANVPKKKQRKTEKNRKSKKINFHIKQVWNDS